MGSDIAPARHLSIDESEKMGLKIAFYREKKYEYLKNWGQKGHFQRSEGVEVLLHQREGEGQKLGSRPLTTIAPVNRILCQNSGSIPRKNNF